MSITRLMDEYFRERRKPPGLLFEAPGSSVPIAPSKNVWDHLDDPEALQRLFVFDNARDITYFLEDLIQLQEHMSHHGRLLVDGLQVLVQINTRSLNRITDLDVEWTNKVDEIYDDVRSNQQ